MRLIQGFLLAAVLLDASLVLVSSVNSTTSPEQTVGYFTDADSGTATSGILTASR